jgi:hypothetical protein
MNQCRHAALRIEFEIVGIVIRTFWQQTELPKLYCVSVATNMPQAKQRSVKKTPDDRLSLAGLLVPDSDAVDPRIRHRVPPVLCRLAGLRLGAKTSEIKSGSRWTKWPRCPWPLDGYQSLFTTIKPSPGQKGTPLLRQPIARGSVQATSLR